MKLMKKQNIIIVIIFIVLFGLFGFQALRRTNFPSYLVKTESVSPLTICGRIKDAMLQEICFHKLETLACGIEFTSVFLYKDLGNYCYKNKCCLYYGKESYTRETFKEFLAIHELSNSHPNYINHQKALLLNPHFCNEMTFWNSFMFDGPKKDDCYRDAALVWRDRSLCEKSDDPDFCYLCTVIQEIGEEKSDK